MDSSRRDGNSGMRRSVKAHLLASQELLVESLYNLSPLLDRLLASRILSHDNYYEVRAETTPPNRARRLLEVLHGQMDEGGACCFLECLKRCKQHYPRLRTWLAEDIAIQRGPTECELQAQLSVLCARLGHSVLPVSLALFSAGTLTQYELELVQAAPTLYQQAHALLSACLSKGETACRAFYSALETEDETLAHDIRAGGSAEVPPDLSVDSESSEMSFPIAVEETRPGTQVESAETQTQSGGGILQEVLGQLGVVKGQGEASRLDVCELGAMLGLPRWSVRGALLEEVGVTDEAQVGALVELFLQKTQDAPLLLSRVRQCNIQRAQLSERGCLLLKLLQEGESLLHHRGFLQLARSQDGAQGHTATLGTKSQDGIQGHTATLDTKSQDGAQGHTATLDTKSQDGAQGHTATLDTKSQDGAQGHTATLGTKSQDGGQAHIGRQQTRIQDGIQAHIATLQTRIQDGAQGHRAALETIFSFLLWDCMAQTLEVPAYESVTGRGVLACVAELRASEAVDRSLLQELEECWQDGGLEALTQAVRVLAQIVRDLYPLRDSFRLSSSPVGRTYICHPRRLHRVTRFPGLPARVIRRAAAGCNTLSLSLPTTTTGDAQGTRSLGRLYGEVCARAQRLLRLVCPAAGDVVVTEPHDTTDVAKVTQRLKVSFTLEAAFSSERFDAGMRHRLLGLLAYAPAQTHMQASLMELHLDTLASLERYLQPGEHHAFRFHLESVSTLGDRDVGQLCYMELTRGPIALDNAMEEVYCFVTSLAPPDAVTSFLVRVCCRGYTDGEERRFEVRKPQCVRLSSQDWSNLEGVVPGHLDGVVVLAEEGGSVWVRE
ncbi:uncharacterized protein LOC134456056, partial [Engraulis encrasicolus]|uniref:uncharacterized protein LOC134456056 n=1 Tax=Engraulis encrasicolus TaxID=184585 RepID=UPI002FD1B886